MNPGARLRAPGTGETFRPGARLRVPGSLCLVPRAQRPESWFLPVPSPRSPVPRGFTLIELTVVLAILSITALLVMPRLFPRDDAALTSSARTLASTLRYLQQQAIATRTNYTMKFQFPDGTITVKSLSESGNEGVAGESPLRERIRAEGVSVDDLVLNSLGRVNEGEVSVRVGMEGFQELLTVHLKSRSGTYTVIAYPVSGKVRIEEGYRDATL